MSKPSSFSGGVLVVSGTELLGDGLMKIPFIKTLKKAYPHLPLTWMTTKGPSVYTSVLQPLVAPYLSEVVESTGLGQSWLSPWGRFGRHHHFDVIIDTTGKWTTTLALRFIPHGKLVSATSNQEKSIVKRLMSLIEKATGKALDLDDTPVCIPVRFHEQANSLLPTHQTYVALAPGAGGQHKCWPLDAYLDLSHRILTAGLVPVFILGPAEASWITRIKAACPQGRFPLQETTETSPLLTMALGLQMKAIVANDSGVGHLLATAERPMISLFGPTPPEKFAPFNPNGIVLKAQTFGSQNMSSIPVDAVWETIRAMILQD